MYQLLEKDVTVRCRKQDLDMVEKSLNPIMEEYLHRIGRPCKVTIDRDNFLSPDW